MWINKKPTEPKPEIRPPAQRPLEISKISTLKISKSDVLIVRCPTVLSVEAATSLRIGLEAALDRFGITCAGMLILEEGISLDVLKPVRETMGSKEAN